MQTAERRTISGVSNGVSCTSGPSEPESEFSQQTRPNTNAAYGAYALSQAQVYAECAAFGHEALRNCIAPETTAVGFRAGRSLTTAQNCTAVGYCALMSATERVIADDCTVFGHRAAMDTNAPGNTVTGAWALLFNVTGRENTITGAHAAVLNVGGSRNCVYGYQSAYGVVEGDDNAVYGHAAQRAIATVSRLTLMGSGAGMDNTAPELTAFGYHALHNNQTGHHNVAFGPEALEGLVSGSHNTAHGAQALQHAWGSDNTVTGSQGMSKGTGTGCENSGHGSHVLLNCIGSRNTADGFRTLSSLTTGNQNAAHGHMALARCVTGCRNAAYGANAGSSIVTTDDNTCLGCGAGPAGDFEDTINLGSGAHATQSGEMALGSAQHPLLTGKLVGPNGDASACPAQPQLYFTVLVNGERYLLPLFKPYAATNG